MNIGKYSFAYDGQEFTSYTAIVQYWIRNKSKDDETFTSLSVAQALGIPQGEISCISAPLGKAARLGIIEVAGSQSSVDPNRPGKIVVYRLKNRFAKWQTDPAYFVSQKKRSTINVKKSSDLKHYASVLLNIAAGLDSHRSERTPLAEYTVAELVAEVARRTKGT